MLTFFPKQISSKSIIAYFVSLAVVSVVYARYAMGWQFMLLGALEVVVFFAFSSICSSRWRTLSQRTLISKLFWTAFLLRIAWVVFSFFFYTSLTGVPFEPGAADSMAYHATAEWLMNKPWSFVFNYLFMGDAVSDSGYALYLTTLYKSFGSSIVLPRVLKAVYGSFICVLIYKLAARSIDETTGRLAGIFAVFMPNLIIYCGLHLKETEMIFLLVAFLERSDYLLRTRDYNLWTILLPLVLAVSLFLFRTVLGAVAVFSLLTGLLFTSTKIVGKLKKVFVVFWMVLGVAYFASGTIAVEIEGYFSERTENQSSKREQQTLRGNQWAQYATGAVLAPMIFVMPFSTMVDVDNQYNQQILHGGNFVRNFMGFFVILALIFTLFINRDWKNMSLVGSYVIGYLGVISMSGFANSERFLLPALPGLIILWAYGLRCLSRKSFRYMSYWIWVVFLMQVAWAYFKLGSRGLF